jgi:hypothetical protein
MVIQSRITFSKFSPWIFFPRYVMYLEISALNSKVKTPKAVFATFDFLTISLRYYI